MKRGCFSNNPVNEEGIATRVQTPISSSFLLLGFPAGWIGFRLYIDWLSADGFPGTADADAPGVDGRFEHTSRNGRGCHSSHVDPLASRHPHADKYTPSVTDAHPNAYFNASTAHQYTCPDGDERSHPHPYSTDADKHPHAYCHRSRASSYRYARSPTDVHLDAGTNAR